MGHNVWVLGIWVLALWVLGVRITSCRERWPRIYNYLSEKAEEIRGTTVEFCVNCGKGKLEVVLHKLPVFVVRNDIQPNFELGACDACIRKFGIEMLTEEAEIAWVRNCMTPIPTCRHCGKQMPKGSISNYNGMWCSSCEIERRQCAGSAAPSPN